MPNDYSGTKKVRKINGQRWIDDFKRLRSVVVMFPGGVFIEVQKQDVWRRARDARIVYSIYSDLYARKREVFTITGAYWVNSEGDPL